MGIVLAILSPFILIVLVIVVFDLTDYSGEHNIIVKKPTKRQLRNRYEERKKGEEIVEGYSRMSTEDLKKELRRLKQFFDDISSEQRERRIYGTANKYSIVFATSRMCEIAWKMDRIREILESRKG